MRVLITGGAGFIGSNLVHYLLRERPDWTLINVDALTYAGNLENLEACRGNPRHIFMRADITDSAVMRDVFTEHRPDAVMHLAAESHVDRSVLDPLIFVRTNVMGTQVLLDEFRRIGGKGRFLHVSTDEVYGSLGATGFFTETTPVNPNSPYSASKAASDFLVRAAHQTHKMDTVITRCSNNYGPFQFPEKLIPLMISNAVEGEPLPVYGRGLNVRDWLYVEDHCAALTLALEKGRAGEVYNIGGHSEMTNIEIVRKIISRLGAPESLIRFVTDRPGHDLRYAIDAGKIEKELGWRPAHTFEEALPLTIQWYLDNKEWLRHVRNGSYREYYQQQYGNRVS